MNARNLLFHLGRRIHCGAGLGKVKGGWQRISCKGGTPFDLATMNITPDGFRLNFTKDIPNFIRVRCGVFGLVEDGCVVSERANTGAQRLLWSGVMGAC